MKVSDLVFKEVLKRGFQLEGKTRVWNIADSKLWYLTSKQAQGYLDLQKEAGYRNSITNKEIQLIKQNLEVILEQLPEKYCNIIDLGCGDGKKAALFISHLAQKIKIRYYPIDISSYMVSKAADTIRTLAIEEVLEFRWNISDFENLQNITPLIRDKVFKNHLLLLLGNTLGNFDRYDMLNEIKESMQKGDLLLIGNGIADSKNRDWVNEYKSEHVNRWLKNVPILLGLRPKDLEYDVRFVNSRVEELYILKRNVTIEHLNRKIEFKQGDVLIAAISYKFTKNDLQNLLKKFFSQVKLVTDGDNTYALAFCKK